MFLPLDGPAIVRVNLFVRSIATISDIKMVSITLIKPSLLKTATGRNSPFLLLPTRLTSLSLTPFLLFYFVSVILQKNAVGAKVGLGGLGLIIE